MPLESEFQGDLVKDIRDLLPGCIIMKNDANYLTGVPDLTVLYYSRWAWLEVKKTAKERPRPNQPYYVALAAEWAFGAFIFPENKEEVLDALCAALRT